MEIIIKGKVPTDPRSRILAIEAAMKAICDEANEDSADGCMALLTAAAHIFMAQSEKSPDEAAPHLADILGHAITAAAGLFKLRPVQSGPVDHSDAILAADLKLNGPSEH